MRIGDHAPRGRRARSKGDEVSKRNCLDCGKTYAHRPPGTHIANDGKGGDTQYIWLGRERLAKATCICEGAEIAAKKIEQMQAVDVNKKGGAS